MSCEATWESPHTFEEAVEYLRAGNHIDYEVKIGGHQGALMTREEWLEAVEHKSFIDYDGMGNEIDEHGTILGTRSAVKDEQNNIVELGDPGWIKPSRASEIRPETKYILWYNR